MGLPSVNTAAQTLCISYLLVECVYIYINQVQASSSEASSIPDISHDEEELLLRYYHIKVQAVCRELRLQRKVINTACTYIKRFYITFTPLMYDPQLMVLPCVYLACKSDECYMSAAELGRLTGVPPEAILRQEILVLQGLNFDMIVHSPYKAIQGFLEVGSHTCFPMWFCVCIQLFRVAVMV